LALAALAAVLAAGVVGEMPEAELRAVMFVSLVWINVCIIFVNRSFASSLLVALRRPNAFLWMLVAVVSAVLAMALSWPPAMELFRFGPLHPDDLGLSAAAGLTVFVVLELVKPLWRAGFRS
jgi:Ca2+-transporting ATPase